MAVGSREQLKEYCLRSLGAPVIQVNVDDEQLEDRIDEALDFWNMYHYDGVEKVYLKHKLSASRLELTTAVADQFNLQSFVTGSTSGASAKVIAEGDTKSSGTTLLVVSVKGDFVSGEEIVSDDDIPITATLDVDPVTLGEIDLRYVDLPDSVYGITRVLPFTGTSNSRNIFDVQYQLRLNDLYDLTSTSIVYYKQVMNHLAMLDMELNTKPTIRFNRQQSRLFLDINWSLNVPAGFYIIVECYRALDPNEWKKAWNEMWLKHYVTALFKRQWGANLKKFGGIQMPGGVVLDGQSIYDEAQGEIKELEDDLMNKAAPLEFFVG